jgi:paraquat-inducible protein A
MTQHQSAMHLGLSSCHNCQLLVRVEPSGSRFRAFCPRCGTALHHRKPNSLARSWALLIAAAVFYIPANVLPISKVSALGSVQADTILSGVIYFLQAGEWPIALVIFVASVFVPLLKLFALSYLLISVQIRSRWRPRDRTRLYRIVEAIGRWSMVDIYVITIMAALVNVGALASFQAGPAAVFFAGVVVLTMFAALSFDPRLIWDPVE